MNDDKLKWPYPGHDQRLQNYKKYDRLFNGQHFEAFAIQINSQNYREQYGKLKYVTVNFAGLISKVSADMLFGEGVTIKAQDNDRLTDWFKNLSFENKLPTQLYESALINSRLGDDLFKVRGGKRNDRSASSSIIIEETRPDIYYPHFKNNNWRSDPEYQDLAFIVNLPGEDKKQYLRVERHYPGYIEHKLFELQEDGSANKVDLKMYDPTLPDSEETGIDRSLVIHTPNWRAGNYWGISDYTDLEPLMYALNNRMTKNENVLDKHTDPILALPEGFTNEKGEIDRKKLDVFTIPDNEIGGGAAAKPEYITWNASLENSFAQIEKLVEFLYMTSETSPGVFGLDKDGQAESGRALKLKLIRTIAKINRKKVFYDQSIKEALYVSQLLAQANGYTALDQRLPSAPELPTIEWRDGLPIDDLEAVELESKRIDAGIQSRQGAIVRLDGISDQEALEKLEEIRKESPIEVPSGITPPPNPDEV